MPGLAGAFMDVFLRSHWYLVVGGVELISGVLLLINRFVPLALILLAAVIVNILVFQLTMMPTGIAPGLIAAALWFIVALPLRAQFRLLIEPS